ncbi:SMC prok B [Papiliotrema laurentii]|uniref:SMC prok B n=1 Tax=Papiliotrema laurentii TaxID=5418 RepID=A0AAD9FNL4_PAPLA|nr:SMC prok B [Papiliotrema laurentii]
MTEQDAAAERKAKAARAKKLLVKQLEEVRGRVVQVMEEKVELAGRVESLEGKSKAWDREREAQVEEIAVGSCFIDVLASGREQCPGASESKSDELAKQVEDLRDQLETARSELEVSQTRVKELENASQEAESDSLASLKSGHALELSQHAEKIRSLETSLHGAESRVHQLSRQLTDLQSQPGANSPGESSSRGLFFSDDGVGAEGRSPLGRGPRPTGVDALLPAHVRHKRQVSLSALKARMEPRRSYSQTSGPAGSLSNVPEGNDEKGFGAGHRRMQFGDEIVFCCPACEGDLISI